ncbi:MAG TPA: bacterioferritin [Terriglobales bacterium]|nr:bacterioferritin [Terriglobales bacterium]
MRGNQNVINELNAALSSELSAIAQYMVQAEMCANWGYGRLAALTKKRAIEEMHHAEHLIERILFLDGMPGVDVTLKPKIGTSVQEHLQLDLEDELDAARQYNNAVNICKEANDAGTRELFEHMIEDEERHADFLEAQLHDIKEMGIANYLSQQMAGEGS